jgi:hypothetical protein
MAPPLLPMLHPLVETTEFDLNALLEHDPPTRWRPEVGERVQGTVAQVADKNSYGKTAKAIFILLDDARYVVVRCGGVVLKGAYDTLHPASGDEIALKYEGMKPTIDGLREYSLTRMAVRRDGRWVTGS